MSQARRRVRHARILPRIGVRTAATLTGLTLVAAVAVPAALAPDGRAPVKAPERTVRGAAAGALRAAPTDQIRARQWHLDDMHVPRAWRWSKGSGVTVAVLDTGVDRRHPDLSGRVVNGPDLTGGARRPGGKYWGLHGTSMASIIAGHGHGPGLQEGVMGIAPQSRILSVRVTWENDDPMRRNGGEVGRNRDAVAQGIRYAVDNGADIINMSLGGGKQFYNGSGTEESAIKYALSKGVVLIASAGNDGAGANRKNFPAAYPGVIAVGALDRKLRVWKDSNRHPYVAVCAPGVEIVSADASSGYVVGTGTSPSSAIVAGVAALVRSRYPKLTPDQVRQALVQGSPARRTPTGSANCPGPLDATRALLAAHKLNKTAGGAPAATPESSSPSPAAAPVEEEGDGTLFLAIIGGGGVLVLLGLVLGWRQRRRPEERPDEPEPALGDPRDPVPAMAGRPGPEAAQDAVPVEAPLWQSNDVGLAGTRADISVPHGEPPIAQTGLPAWPDQPAPEAERPEPPRPPSELRPFIVGEAGAQHRPEANGTAPRNGHAPEHHGSLGKGRTPGGFERLPEEHDPLGIGGVPEEPGRPGAGHAPEGHHSPGAGRPPEDHDPLGIGDAPTTSDPLAHGLPGLHDPFDGSAAAPRNGHDPHGERAPLSGTDPLSGRDPLDPNTTAPLSEIPPEAGSPLYGAGPQGGRDAGDPDPLDIGAVPTVGDPPASGEVFDDNATFDDDEWERFRRSALGEPPSGTTGTQPVVPPEELPTGAFPAAPPPGLAERPPAADPLEDDPLRQPPRNRRPADEDDYRPPWW
ncbi:S8 family serine peptidase [Spirillospora sp. NPDC127200]